MSFLSPNTSRDLNLTKNVRRLETTSDIDVQIKASEKDTILCYESLFNTQAKMLISFNSLLIDKVQCVSSGNILPEFFSSPLYMQEFFLARWSSARFLFLCMCTYIFFSKSPNPPPPPPLRSKMVGPLGKKVLFFSPESNAGR